MDLKDKKLLYWLDQNSRATNRIPADKRKRRRAVT